MIVVNLETSELAVSNSSCRPYETTIIMIAREQDTTTNMSVNQIVFLVRTRSSLFCWPCLQSFDDDALVVRCSPTFLFDLFNSNINSVFDAISNVDGVIAYVIALTFWIYIYIYFFFYNMNWHDDQIYKSEKTIKLLLFQELEIIREISGTKSRPHRKRCHHRQAFCIRCKQEEVNIAKWKRRAPQIRLWLRFGLLSI